MSTDDLDTANAPADGAWEFDESVAAAFDDMLERSIPNYPDMRRFVTEAAAYFVRRSHVSRPLVVDLGASRGGALGPIIDKVGAHGRYLACDVSEPMLAACRERFAGWIEAGRVEVRRHDLRTGFPETKAPVAVVLLALTLQFVPIEYRQTLLRQIYEQLLPGGALLLVEKVMGGTAEADDLLRTLYWDEKVRKGYAQEAVERKALSLEGVLVPLTARFDEELLRAAGFPDPECVWRWGPFVGWVAQKR